MSLSLCSNSFTKEQLYLIFNVCLIFNVALSHSNNAPVLSWKWWTRWRTKSVTTTTTRKPYGAWSRGNIARRKSAGKSLSFCELSESWIRFCWSKQVDGLAGDQQSAWVHVYFSIALWCLNEIINSSSLKELESWVLRSLHNPSAWLWQRYSRGAWFSLVLQGENRILYSTNLQECHCYISLDVSVWMLSVAPPLSSSCPVVGCGNTDVRESDLVPDQMLRRKILSQKRQANRT